MELHHFGGARYVPYSRYAVIYVRVPHDGTLHEVEIRGDSPECAALLAIYDVDPEKGLEVTSDDTYKRNESMDSPQYLRYRPEGVEPIRDVGVVIGTAQTAMPSPIRIDPFPVRKGQLLGVLVHNLDGGTGHIICAALLMTRPRPLPLTEGTGWISVPLRDREGRPVRSEPVPFRVNAMRPEDFTDTIRSAMGPLAPNVVWGPSSGEAPSMAVFRERFGAPLRVPDDALPPTLPDCSVPDDILRVVSKAGWIRTEHKGEVKWFKRVTVRPGETNRVEVVSPSGNNIRPFHATGPDGGQFEMPNEAEALFNAAILHGLFGTPVPPHVGPMEGSAPRPPMMFDPGPNRHEVQRGTPQRFDVEMPPLRPRERVIPPIIPVVIAAFENGWKRGSTGSRSMLWSMPSSKGTTVVVASGDNPNLPAMFWPPDRDGTDGINCATEEEALYRAAVAHGIYPEVEGPLEPDPRDVRITELLTESDAARQRAGRDSVTINRLAEEKEVLGGKLIDASLREGVLSSSVKLLLATGRRLEGTITEAGNSTIRTQYAANEFRKALDHVEGLKR